MEAIAAKRRRLDWSAKMTIRWRRQVWAAGVLAALAAASGCVGYRLGSTLPAGIKSVHVPIFINETREPQLEARATQATIQEFQRDGTLRVAARENADLVIDVKLTGLTLQPLRYQRDKALAVQEYRMVIAASIVLTRQGNKPVIMLEKKVIGEATFVLTGDMSSSKQTALPDATRDLAHKIVQETVEYW
jgi:hypothetical protein